MIKPVHASEIKSYLKCSLRWFWSAPPPRGLGLEPKRTRAALNTGRVVHKALQDGYDKQLPFVDTYQSAMNECLAEIERPDGAVLTGLETGKAMMAGYQAWADLHDEGVQFIATETKWEGISLGGIPFAGRFDAVIKRDDGIWLLDFKTTKYRNNPWTTTDLQATIYTWAARQLYGPYVRGLIFRFLRKKAPWTYEDLILKNGEVSTRKNLANNTTYEEYITAQAVAAMQHLAKDDFIFAAQIGLEDTKDVPLTYYRALLDGTQQEQEWYPTFKETFLNIRKMYYSTSQELKGQNNFFWEIEEYRTEEQLDNYIKYLILPAAERIVSKNKWVGPTGLGSFGTCDRCDFRDPCRLRMNGANFHSVLDEEYQTRDIYRKDYKEADDGQTV